MSRRWRDQLTSLGAVLALIAIAGGVTLYILQHQRLRIPLLEPAPFTLKAEFSTAQAVVPGQGQTIRVAGVRIGDVGRTELRDGRAVVHMDLDRRYDGLVRTDATAFLRPRTGLKDMFVELNPGTRQAPAAREGWVVPIASTLPDVNQDEILAGLDADTRDYFKLLISGAGQGLEGRGGDLRDVLRRFEPTFRDQAAFTREVALRRRALRRLIRSLNLVNGALARRDDDVARLIRVSAPVLRTLAQEREGVEGTIRELPGALEATRTSLARVESFADALRPAADDLAAVARSLTRANRATIPFAREAAPILRSRIRPFVRSVRPLVRGLLPAADDLEHSEHELARSFKVLNTLFNMLAHNPRGREGAAVAGRDEGFLFLLSWAAHVTASVWSNADAHGVLRSVTLGGTCQTLASIASNEPELGTIFGLTGPLTDPLICGDG